MATPWLQLRAASNTPTEVYPGNGCRNRDRADPPGVCQPPVLAALAHLYHREPRLGENSP